MTPLLKTLPIAAALLLGCRGGESSRLEPTVPAVAIHMTPAHQEQLEVLYRTSGAVRGRATAILTSKTTGYLRSIEVRPGDKVKAGQLLAVLEANDSSASVRRARAGFDQSLESRTEAENGLRAAQAALRIAQSTHDRIASLYESRALPQQEYDEAVARLQGAQAQEAVAQARVRVSGSRINQAQAEVGEAQAMLDYARIVAPFSGRVIERRLDPGNLASPGMPLLVIEQDGGLRVETAVEEARASSIVLGETALVEFEARAEPVTGVISEIVPTVDAATRAFLVKVDLPPNLDGLRPGMFARVGFRVGREPCLVVPTTAVSRQGALDRVFAADGDHLRLRMVTLGEAQGPWTRVLSGLEAGERVVALASAAARDGARFTELP